MVESEFGVSSMNPWTQMNLCQQFKLPWRCDGVGNVSWHTLGSFIPIEHCVNAITYLSIVADHVYPFIATITHLIIAAYSIILLQSTSCLNLVLATLQQVFQLPSTFTRSESNKALWGCGRTDL